MGFLCQPFANPAQGARSDVSSPLLETAWRPALLFAVAFRHMFRERAHPRDGFTRMARDQMLLVIDLKQSVASMELQLLAHILVWHRVVVLLIADVIVDVDLDRFDGDIAIGCTGSGPSAGRSNCSNASRRLPGSCLNGRSLSSFNKARMHWLSSASEKKV